MFRGLRNPHLAARPRRGREVHAWMIAARKEISKEGATTPKNRREAKLKNATNPATFAGKSGQTTLQSQFVHEPPASAPRREAQSGLSFAEAGLAWQHLRGRFRRASSLPLRRPLRRQVRLHPELGLPFLLATIRRRASTPLERPFPPCASNSRPREKNFNTRADGVRGVACRLRAVAYPANPVECARQVTDPRGP